MALHTTLYNIIQRRHLRCSTVITTNLSFKQWGTHFPGAACIGALIDRFVQHCYVLDIDADSYRQKLNKFIKPCPLSRHTLPCPGCTSPRSSQMQVT